MHQRKRRLLNIRQLSRKRGPLLRWKLIALASLLFIGTKYYLRNCIILTLYASQFASLSHCHKCQKCAQVRIKPNSNTSRIDSRFGFKLITYFSPKHPISFRYWLLTKTIRMCYSNVLFEWNRFRLQNVLDQITVPKKWIIRLQTAFI